MLGQGGGFHSIAPFLLQILNQQREYLFKELGVSLVVVGLWGPAGGLALTLTLEKSWF